jgi:hypothetical protein
MDKCIVQFGGRHRKRRKICTDRYVRFFRSPLESALRQDFAFFAMVVNFDSHN